MKSLCIKTNNSNLLNYLLNELKNTNFKNICFSENEFKIYKNIIIHYTGNDNFLFLSKISSILSFLVIDELEENLLRRLIIQNYFYFDNAEIKKIISICFDIMADNFSEIFDKKFKTLHNIFYQFLSTHKSLILNGFINFRLKNYILILDEIVNEAVNSFIIEKEYKEFISLLKLYINSQPYGCKLVHIIFSSSESVLLDENKKQITVDDDIFKAKYLSDISFSSNDYILNSLLTLLPKEIYIHIIDGYTTNEFIDTLKLIYENRIHLCTDCNICKLYTNAINNSNIKIIPHSELS
jgi:putative sporulation protein YtxC